MLSAARICPRSESVNCECRRRGRIRPLNKAQACPYTKMVSLPVARLSDFFVDVNAGKSIVPRSAPSGVQTNSVVVSQFQIIVFQWVPWGKNPRELVPGAKSVESKGKQKENKEEKGELKRKKTRRGRENFSRNPEGLSCKAGFWWFDKRKTEGVYEAGESRSVPAFHVCKCGPVVLL